jgi:gas vesicle structural protein
MIESAPASWSVIDLLDRVLDNGIVIDSSVRVTVPGIELLAVDVVVVSITVYLTYASMPISALRSRAIASETEP